MAAVCDTGGMPDPTPEKILRDSVPGIADATESLGIPAIVVLHALELGEHAKGRDASGCAFSAYLTGWIAGKKAAEDARTTADSAITLPVGDPRL